VVAEGEFITLKDTKEWGGGFLGNEAAVKGCKGKMQGMKGEEV
jgi:hypothetical protein